MAEITSDQLAFLASQPNITEYISDDMLMKMGLEAKQGVQIDLHSRSKWEENAKKIMEFIHQPNEKKIYPFPNASNVRYPLILVSASQFNARAYPSIINSGNIALTKVIGADPNGEKQAKADRISRHMSWQLTEEMDEWDKDMDKLLFVLPLLGVSIKKVYFDPSSGRNVSEFVHPFDFIVNNSCKSLKTCPRASHRIWFYPNEIRENINLQIFREGDYNLKVGSLDNHEPIEFFEQHSWWDLDDDGYAEPYIVTFCSETGEVARVAPNFRPEGIFLNSKGEVVKIEKEDYFVDYTCFPDPEGGFYGLGFGNMLLALNASVDSILNQLIDAGHLANTGGGFIAKTFRIESGALRFSPGEWKKVDTAGFPMKDAVLPLPVSQPSQVLFSLLGLLIEAGKDVSSIQEVMTGGGGQGTPATTVLALIEQGMKVYTAIFKRIYASLRQELVLLFKLNARYLDPKRYAIMQDDPKAISSQDYDVRSLDVIPAADPSMATDIQKAAKVQVLMQFMGVPGANIQEIMLEALRASGITEAEKYILPNQGPSPEQTKELAEAEAERQRIKLETIDTLASAFEKMAKSDENGGNNLTNLRELMFAAKEIIGEEREDDEGRDTGVEGAQPLVSGLAPGDQGPIG